MKHNWLLTSNKLCIELKFPKCIRKWDLGRGQRGSGGASGVKIIFLTNLFKKKHTQQENPTQTVPLQFGPGSSERRLDGKRILIVPEIF